ncbi:MAG: FadR/GntR family transcriptional regulator [Hyphomicrobiaceae bacterium]
MQDEQTLARVRAYMSDMDLELNSKLPPERDLCASIGVTRAALRRALDILESEGQIWRHVGRGTFIGARPVENIDDVAYLANRSNPTKMMEARLHVEPELARLAAHHASNADFEFLRRCLRKSRAAREWRVYEAWDTKFHAAIATATHNHLLISLADTLNIVRRATVWGQMRDPKVPPADHLSFAEHDAIFDAIVQRDGDSAAENMRRHLITVRDRVLRSCRAQ